MRNKSPVKLTLIAVVALLLLILPLMVDNYLIHVVNQVGIFIILTSALNIMVGYTGQLSFVHVGLFAIGAYTSSILSIDLGLPFLVALPIAAVAAAIIGFLIGFPALRFKTHFFAIVTLAFAEIIRLLIYNLRDLTGGPNGIYSIPFPESFLWFDFSQRSHFYYITLFFVVITLVFVRYLIGTRTGKAMLAVRENETFAKFIGINTWKVKMTAFTISAFIAGIAGSLFAHYNSYISPYSFTIADSVTFLLMVIIGGMGTIVGPIVGTAFLTFLPEMLRSVADLRMVIYGLLLILTIMFLPRGIVGLFKDLYAYFQIKKSPEKPIFKDMEGGKQDVGS
ncbi:branched-chain amino acid ABC transporter permease [Alkalihalobacillus sp. BA299]|uniref:branched-chain amino acid ABC transporter permease n=1 Tax=Alkalihalobacillus sp. BA299 TaxID=2815938 RepID=UPI001ADB7C78|nr:branched-chain amino acid ABC transporter permease [Alkalihalobacillus sp. BA299]